MARGNPLRSHKPLALPLLRCFAHVVHRTRSAPRFVWLASVSLVAMLLIMNHVGTFRRDRAIAPELRSTRSQPPSGALPASLHGGGASDDPGTHARLSSSHRTVSTMGPDAGNTGVVVFFHLNKAGGTSIETNLRPLPHVTYTFSPTGPPYHKFAQKMDRWVAGTEPFPRGTVHVMEVHSRGNTHPNPSFADAYDRLMRWRDAFRKKLNVPFFAFSIVREPVSHLMSAFNYHCVENRKCGERKKAVGGGTQHVGVGGVDDFLRLAHPNMQCGYFLRQWLALSEQETELQRPPTAEECSNLYRDKMTRFFDWIGTTERYDDTVRVLERVLFGRDASNTTFASSFRKSNVTPKKGKRKNKRMVSLDALNDTSRGYLESITLLDRELHQKVQADYKLEHLHFV